MKRCFLLLTFLISLSALIFSSIKIIDWINDNKKTDEQIKKIQGFVDVSEIVDNNKVELVNQAATTSIDNPYWDYIKFNLINVDINKLKAVNNDTIGWIKVNGTNINYPFMQTNNNDYYLYHSFNKEWNYAGWIFLDYRNDINEFNRNNIIYGHGRNDGTMFGSLKNVLSKNWLNNSDNFIIRLSRESDNTLWQIFSVYHIPTTNDYTQVNFSDDEFLDFIDLITKRSFYNFNTIVNEKDKILTLSTCLNNSDKVVVHAKLIKIEKK